MSTGISRHAHRRAVAATLLGLLVLGTAATPASAESIRDKQWHLDAMKAEQMWKMSTGKGVTVAVIDTGVDWTNGDLKGQVLPGKDYAPGEPGDEHTDYEGHGTGMAGLIAGTGKSGGGNGAYGLAPGAKILPIRLRPSSSIDGVKDISAAIRYAADSHAKVINIAYEVSIGDQRLTSAVEYALKKGSLIFGAAGNNGDEDNNIAYPAGTPGVVAVAAIGKDLHRTKESQHGPQIDMAAPGEDMVEACGKTKSGLCTSHGTSDATALASASAALIWSVHPDWTNNQVLRVMLNTIGGPTDGKKRNDSIGYGIVRPRVALTNPGDPGPANKYPLPDYPAKSTALPTSNTGANAPAAEPKKDQQSNEASSSPGDGGTSILWITLAALAVLAAGLSVATAVRRRSAGRT